MARLRFKNQIPPGGFKFLQKETMLTIHGESLGDLVSKVKAHREHKGLTPTDEASISLEVERQICGRLGKQLCIAEGAADEWTPVPDTGDFLDLGKIKAFSAAAWDWMKNGAEFVPMEEAKRRASICDTCVANDSFSGCKCGPLAQWISTVIPRERVIPSLDNRGCLVCSCALQTLVHAPASAIKASEEARPLAYPNTCWKLGL